jgi:two-component system chemotaxis response regulator CheY
MDVATFPLVATRMDFAQQFKRSGPAKFTDAERKNASILVIEPEASLRNSLRQMLIRLGYGTVSDASDHIQALKKFEERRFSHVIFEAKKTSMPTTDFLTKIIELDSSVITIPASWEPNVDDVFGLLIIGARGFIVKPFTEESVDESIIMASKGEPISDAILYAKDRNEALASLIMTQLDKLATTLRQSQHFETARREIPRRTAGLRRTMDIGRTFARGGPDKLLESLVEFCLERSDGPATRLGRLRKRLVGRKPLPQSKTAAPGADAAPAQAVEGPAAEVHVAAEEGDAAAPLAASTEPTP